MKKGFIAGNFDVIHPGYIKMFKSVEIIVIILLFFYNPTQV